VKESAFIQQNKEKWREYEALLRDKNARSDLKLADAFEGITDDLVYARTHFRHRSVRVYLNHLAKRLFSQLHRKRRDKWQDVLSFVHLKFPVAMWAARYEILLSFLLFAFSFLIGWLSSHQDPSFDELILGERYVRMTEANIASGDPMAVYKTSQPDRMFLFIFLNNLWVDFLTLCSGILFGLGTFFILLRNGIMIGSFQHFFVARGYTIESLNTIWMHGTLEITAIILSGAAGFSLASGLIYSGHRSRMDALRLSAAKAIYLLVGIIPITFMAALIEGYLTGAELPELFRWLLIAISFVGVMGYFVVFALYRGRQLQDLPLMAYRPVMEREVERDPSFVADIGYVVQAAFKRLFQRMKWFFPAAFGLSLLYALWLQYENVSLKVRNYRILSSEITQIMDLPKFNYLFKSSDAWHAWLMGCFIFVGLWVTAMIFFLHTGDKHRWNLRGILIKTMAFGSCALILTIFMYDFVWLAVFINGLILMAYVISEWHPSNKSLNEKAGFFNLLKGSKLWLSFLLTSLIALVAFTAINAPLFYILREGILMHFIFSDSLSSDVLLVGRFAILWSFVFLYLALLLLVFNETLTYENERITSTGLKQKLAIQGLG
jgi:uncharacterized membrane protein SpoIIM required for sporulation